MNMPKHMYEIEYTKMDADTRSFEHRKLQVPCESLEDGINIVKNYKDHQDPNVIVTIDHCKKIF